MAHTVDREGAPAGGTWWVDLVPCRTAADVVRTLADTLGVPLPPTGDEAVRRAALLAALAERDHLLVVVDNAEHVVEVVRDLVGAAEPAAPRAWFLVTSRTPLRTAYEHVVPVGALDATAGVALLEARARRAAPEFELSAQDRLAARALVTRLEGWPLALELAGARLPALGARPLLTRLAASLDVLGGEERRADGRAATLDATLAWSWDLLDDEARAALCGLTVFRGAFCAGDAEAVLGPAGARCLAVLQDHSLVHALQDEGGERRSRLYVSVRAFAQARRAEVLGPAAWEATARAHAAWAARWGALGVHWTHVALQSPDLYRTLPRHRGDVEAAWRFARARADAGLMVPLALALGFLHVRWGPFAGGLPPLEAALGLPVLPGKAAVDLRVMLVLLLTRTGRPDEALPLLDAALSIAADQDRARVLLSRAMVQRVTGDIEGAVASLDAARAAQDDAGAPGVAGHIENTAGILASHHARYDEGEACFARAMAHYEAAGLRREQGMVALNHAGDLATRGRVEEGRALMARAVALARDGEDLRLLSYALGNQGLLEARHGSLTRAWERLVEAEQIHRRIGDANGIGTSRLNQAFVLMAQDRFAEAGVALEDAVARFEATSNRYWGAVATLDLARVRVHAGDLAAATALADAAGAFFDERADPGGQARVAFVRARIGLAAGTTGEAALLAARVACTQHEQALEAVERLVWLGRVAPDPADAARWLRQALADADRTSQPAAWVDAAVELGGALVAQGAWAEGVALLREAIERARRASRDAREVAARAALSTALLDDGAVAEAEHELQAAARLSASLGDRGRVGRVRVSQARLALVRGRTDDALAYASQAREDAVAGGVHVTEVEAWALRAQARRARGEPGWRADADVATVRARAAGLTTHPAVTRALAAAVGT